MVGCLTIAMPINLAIAISDPDVNIHHTLCLLSLINWDLPYHKYGRMSYYCNAYQSSHCNIKHFISIINTNHVIVVHLYVFLP